MFLILFDLGEGFQSTLPRQGRRQTNRERVRNAKKPSPRRSRIRYLSSGASSFLALFAESLAVIPDVAAASKLLEKCGRAETFFRWTSWTAICLGNKQLARTGVGTGLRPKQPRDLSRCTPFPPGI